MKKIIRRTAALFIVLLGSCAAWSASLDGDWSGNLRCEASSINPDDSQPFTHPILMMISGKNVKITRDTHAITENSVGQIGRGGSISLSGIGQRKDPARAGSWTTAIEGRFASNHFSGTQAIYNKNGRKTRDCTIELAQSVRQDLKAPIAQHKADVAPLVTIPKPAIAVVPSVVVQTPMSETPAAKQISPAVIPVVVPAEITPPAVNASSPLPPVQSQEMTLIGTTKWGATDSCFEVQDGTKTRCYGFMAQGAVATTLGGVCKQGDRCTVTGEFDHAKELLLSVTKAVTLDVETKPAAVVPTAAIEPSAVTKPAQGLSGTAILATVAVIVAALVGTSFIFWKRRRDKTGKRVQVTEPALTQFTAVKSPQSEIKEIVPSVLPSAPATQGDTFQVVLKGIGSNLAPSEAHAELAALFKASPEQTEKMLAMPAYVVKKAVPLDVASKYKRAIESAGGICEVVPEDVEPALFLDVDLPTSEKDSSLLETLDIYSERIPPVVSTNAVAIWNPKAVVRWSFLVTPAFGSCLQMLNWRAMGEPAKASGAQRWFYGSIAILIIYAVLVVFQDDIKGVHGAARGLFVWYYIAWYFASGRSQVAYVKTKFGATYPRKPWTKPFLILTGTLVVYLLAVGSLMVSFGKETTGPAAIGTSKPDTGTRTEATAVNVTPCGEGYTASKFPEAWRTAYLLADVNTPEPFPAYMCTLSKKGAQVRYLPGGMLSDEGFEVKGKSLTVQVFTEVQRVPGTDQKSQLIVPVAAKVDGNKMTITRENYRAFHADLIVAALNQ